MNEKSYGNINVIQWYPGHMAKAKREISEILRFVDIAVIIGDARLPKSSINPEIFDILGNKPYIIALNKADLIPPLLRGGGIDKVDDGGVRISSLDGTNFGQLKTAINNKIHTAKLREKSRGLENRAIRILVVGCPNTGKSAFINKFAGRSAMEVANRAGVTKKQQWIKVRSGGQNYDLLDTPGILPPKFETRAQGERLAWIGAIKEDILDKIEIAVALCGFLHNIEDNNEKYDKFLEIGRAKGLLIRGGEIDEERTAKLLLTDFRSGKLGKYILE
ncbi:MAG: ribosome biogenesis GTPase YlqF [Oscillospiraceae bacterium]|nr:ribosome biogenesis GTPase YlqF [Oscillospiraceae bacterium]